MANSTAPLITDETGQEILQSLENMAILPNNIANNLTTQDSTKVLSASMGVQIGNALGTLNDKVNSLFSLLWTNPNPTSEFAAQNVSLDLTGYKAIIVVAIDYISRPYRTSTFCPVDGGTSFILCPYAENTINNFSGRRITVDSSGVYFGTGINQSGTNAGNAVPIYIYGIKQVNTSINSGNESFSVNTKTISGTTDSNGNIDLYSQCNIPADAKPLYFIQSTTVDVWITPFHSINGHPHLHAANWNGTAKGSTAIAGTLYYFS